MMGFFRTAGPRAALAAVLLSAAACSDGTPLGAPGPAEARAGADDVLLTVVSGAPLAGEQERVLGVVRSRQTTAGAEVARAAAAPRELLRHGRALVLNVGPGRRFVALGERVAQRGTYLAWSGPVQGTDGWVDLVLTERGITGSLRAGREQYTIEPLGGGLHAVARVDLGKLPPDHGGGAPSGIPLALPAAPRAALGTPVGAAPAGILANRTPANYAGPFTDLLVLYTPAVAASHGDVAGLIAQAVESSNASYENSYVDVGVYLAGSQQVTYSEAGRSFTQHVTAMQNASDGLMDGVPGLRNTTIADVVVLLVDDNEACGEAATINASATNAYAAVHYACIPNNYSFQHEVGHLQGARHDRFVDASSTPYAYGHGYIAPNKAWRTIMAYADGCGGVTCPRINFWSNPYVTHPDGQAMGTSTYEYNALVLNNRKYTLRDFRTLPAPQNVAHANPGVSGAMPQLTWSAVTGVDMYLVQRCVVSSGGSVTDSCFFRPDGPNVYSTSFQDFQVTQNNSCPRVAHYRVRSSSRHGTSAYQNQVSICVS